MASTSLADFSSDKLPSEIQTLKQRIEALPPGTRERLLPLCEWVTHYCRLQSRLLRVAQNTIDQLDLDAKYLRFDVEATRRERDALLLDSDRREDDDATD